MTWLGSLNALKIIDSSSNHGPYGVDLEAVLWTPERDAVDPSMGLHAINGKSTVHYSDTLL